MRPRLGPAAPPRLPRRAVAAAIAVAAALAASALPAVPWVGRLVGAAEETTRDWRMRAAPRRPADASPVVLVMLDSAQARQWPYLSPYPRAALADVVEAISAAGPRAIGLDVYLDRRYPALDSLARGGAPDRGDERLRDAIARAGNVVLAGGTEQRGDARVPMPVDPYFADAAAAVAAADLPTPYETVRETALSVEAGGRRVPGFALALYALARGTDPDSLLGRAARTGRLAVPGLPARHARVPREAVHRAPILFLGPPSRPEDEGDGTFTVFPASLLVELGEAAPREWFAGKTVLVGSGFHESERFRTPFYDRARSADGTIQGWTYGVEVHANALENLLAGRFPRPLPPLPAFALALAVALGVAAALFRFGIAWGAAAAALLAAGNAGAALPLFGLTAVQAPILVPVLAAAFAFAGSTSWLSLIEGREKRAIRRAFSRYLSPAVVRELVRDPSRLRLGGEKRETTILFTDLAGFTTLSERSDPHELVELLNRYLDEMTARVIEERGLLDKYIGDALMALYGVPHPLPDHALRACRSALAMQRRLAELNGEWRERWAPLGMRVGIHTGAPVVGNIGGRDRFDYTALGDAVNLAARLEPACKTFGVGIVISDATRAAAGDGIVTRELGVLGVYGRAEAVAVHELVGLAGEELGARAEVLAHFAEGLAAYRERRFRRARASFARAARLDPEDGPTRLYLRRCRRLIAAPPPADWTYVERRTVK